MIIIMIIIITTVNNNITVVIEQLPLDGLIRSCGDLTLLNHPAFAGESAVSETRKPIVMVDSWPSLTLPYLPYLTLL